MFFLPLALFLSCLIRSILFVFQLTFELNKSLFAVAGEGLQEILQTGNMILEKTLALLAKRGVVASQGSQMKEGADTSHPLHDGEVNQDLVDAMDENPHRKRSRGDRASLPEKRVTAHRPELPLQVDDVEKIVGEEVVDGLEVGACDRRPIISVRSSGKSFTPVKIEIGEDEKWTSGNKQPLQAFDAFRLAQDYEPYLHSSRSELVLRSKRRVGRVCLSFICPSLLSLVTWFPRIHVCDCCL